MKGLLYKKWYLVLAILVVLGAAFCLFSPAPKVDFNTEVKPILNKKCISCHGGVKAKGGFSVLFREEALAPTKSGKPAIIPGDGSGSEMIRRIKATDPEDRMPYKHPPLSDEEIKTLETWIDQGAEWGIHWAYQPLKEIPLPEENAWAKNEIDRFIIKGWEKLDLSASPEATKEQLLRRVSLDIIGMPAPDSIANSFLKASDDRAYERLVDQLLALPQYGEKWTTMWLDLARYADTRGYEADRGRTIWKYRDWVIKAFNADKPYNQFLIEQMAGDLMPNATDDQYIATAFHRNAMTNDEGGTDNEEFRTAAVMDRINTTWTGILGTSFSCVQCHSHPYDPIRHDEYYKFMAFLNNSRDEDTEAEYPLLRQYASEDSLKLEQVRSWIQQTSGEAKAKEWNLFLKTWQPTINSLLCDKFENAALVSSWYAGIRKDGSCRLKDIQFNQQPQLQYRYITWKNGGVWTIRLDSLNGKILATVPLENTNGSWKIKTINFPQLQGKHTLYYQYANSAMKSFEETGVLFEWFRLSDPFPGAGKPGYETAFANYQKLLEASVQTTPILIENNNAQFRKTQVFERGNWLVKGKEVAAAVPAVFNPLPTNAPNNRMGLALWLTDQRNPLTSRTFVNRIWEQLFGTGIVETLEDLGTQGTTPTHPELLNWMSYQFMTKDAWSIKKLVRRIVLSATYRQSSALSTEAYKKDPYNRYYARGPRMRLSAEQIRDQALFISGVLSNKMYGPGVMPYQPDGIWNSPYNGAQWIQSKGEDQYRRALYTYWKRSAAYPSTVAFDGPGRQVCTARRIRTNTPLQALTLMNDPAYLDMTRKFAYKIMSAGKDLNAQISYGYQRATGQKISDKSLQVLLTLYNKSLASFKADKERTCEMIGVMDEHNNPPTAAMVVVANAIMNLDEVITKY